MRIRQLRQHSAIDLESVILSNDALDRFGWRIDRESPEEITTREQMSAILTREIDRMPVLLRSAFLLREVDNLALASVAERLKFINIGFEKQIVASPVGNALAPSQILPRTVSI